MRYGAILTAVMPLGLLVVASVATAAYPTALVYPQEDGTYLYKVTIWNLPPEDNMHVSFLGLTAASAVEGTGFAPEGWHVGILDGSVAWLVEYGDQYQYMIPPGKSGWGFGFLATGVPESIYYWARGWDPVGSRGTKWHGYFTPQIVPEPVWGFAAMGLAALLAVRVRRGRR
jgi:hypothetical protein